MLLKDDFGGFPVDRLSHSLQTATHAHQDGKDEEYVVCALLHDTLATRLDLLTMLMLLRHYSSPT